MRDPLQNLHNARRAHHIAKRSAHLTETRPTFLSNIIAGSARQSQYSKANPIHTDSCSHLDKLLGTTFVLWASIVHLCLPWTLPHSANEVIFSVVALMVMNERGKFVFSRPLKFSFIGTQRRSVLKD